MNTLCTIVAAAAVAVLGLAALLPGGTFPAWLLFAAAGVGALASVPLFAAHRRRTREHRMLLLAPALLGARHVELEDQELIDASGLSPHAVYATLGWMETAGWVSHRGVRYLLTAEGRTQLQQLAGPLADGVGA